MMLQKTGDTGGVQMGESKTIEFNKPAWGNFFNFVQTCSFLFAITLSVFAARELLRYDDMDLDFWWGSFVALLAADTAGSLMAMLITVTSNQDKDHDSDHWLPMVYNLLVSGAYSALCLGLVLGFERQDLTQDIKNAEGEMFFNYRYNETFVTTVTYARTLQLQWMVIMGVVVAMAPMRFITQIYSWDRHFRPLMKLVFERSDKYN